MIKFPLTPPLLAAVGQGLLQLHGHLPIDEAIPPGHPQQTGVWRMVSDGDAVTLQWYGDPAIMPDHAALIALYEGAEWLAHRKRALKVGLVGTVTAPVTDAWASVPEMIRLHNPQLLSVANQSRHAADMTAMAGALSAAQQAIDAAQTIAEAEAAAAAVAIPTPAGPEE